MDILDYSKWIKAVINESGPISKAGYKALKASRAFVSEEKPYSGDTTYTLGWEKGVCINFKALLPPCSTNLSIRCQCRASSVGRPP